jgi:hypothetical protein
MRARLVSLLILAIGAVAPACGSDADEASATGGASGGGGDASIGGGGGSDSGGVSGASGASGAAGAAGAPSLCPPDADGDGLSDDLEGKAEGRDTDGDGIPDYLDLDSDGDTIPDSVEADIASLGCLNPADSDGDGIPNHLDTDSDNNGIPDRDEVYPDGSAYDPLKGVADTDGDGIPDPYDPDNDGDTIADVEEMVGGKPVDTDGDGLHDHNDLDSDGDTIADVYETAADFDGDGTPNFRDLDSDNDGVPDACEAGPGHKLADPPADTDQDGKYDFIDLDSDNDGLPDGLEDKNGNCQLDPGETRRDAADSDLDGASDLIEVSLGSNPLLKSETPQSLGKYYFEMPYQQTPKPASQTMVLETKLNKGDIAFVVDTTGTMSGAIANIKAGLTSIVSAVKQEVPDAHFGVMAHEDYPLFPYGSSDNLPARLPSQTAYLSAQVTDTLSAVQSLTIRDGSDIAESQIAALWKSLSNGVLTWPGGGIQPAFSPPSGGFGALGFRHDALPILISITDAPFHNGRFIGATQLHDTYSFNGQGSGAPPTVDTLIAEMSARGAKLIGVSLDGGGPARSSKDPYRDLATIVDATKSLVDPLTAFGMNGQCKTDVFGGALPLDGPDMKSCRLIFSVYPSGAGTSERIVDGIKALLRGIKVEMRVLAVSVQPPYLSCGGTLVDSVDDFIETIEVYHFGQVEDPAAPGMFCETLDINDLRDNWSGPRGVVPGPDSKNESATNVTPGIRICYEVKPKLNLLCPQKDQVQIARASLLVKAKNEGQAVELDVGDPRDIFFVIPPNPQ